MKINVQGWNWKKKSIKKMIQNKNNRNLKECGPNLKTN